jgi:cell division protein FtsL
MMLLGYVHAQTSIYRISYSIEAKERQFAELSEDFKRAKFQVAQLRSPSHLSRRAKEASLELMVPREHEIVRILTDNAEVSQLEDPVLRCFPTHSWFGFVREAIANTPTNE